MAVVASAVFSVDLASFGPSTLALQSVTTESADSSRTDYVDDSGNLTVAANVGYATVVRDLDESGHPVLETYYDDKGNPVCASSGQYALSNEWDGARNVRSVYLDRLSQPVNISSGYAFVVRKFNAADQAIYEWYLDAAGDVVACTSGYAAISKEYNGSGQVVEERYFDADGLPCANAQGEFGKSYSYDAEGRQAEVVSLGDDGEPFMNKLGCCRIVKSFHDDGTVDTERYYDVDGQPVALSDGRYAAKYEDGSLIKLDADGNELFAVSDLWNANPWLPVAIGVLLALLVACLSRKGKVVFLAVYAVFILSQTLLRDAGGVQHAELVPFWSYCQFFSNYNLRVEIIDNIWLFVPLGAAVFGLVGKRWSTSIILLIAASVAIECVQFAFSLGTCEVDDVISNTLGGVIGALIASCVAELKARRHLPCSDSRSA